MFKTVSRKIPQGLVWVCKSPVNFCQIPFNLKQVQPRTWPLIKFLPLCECSLGESHADFELGHWMCITPSACRREKGRRSGILGGWTSGMRLRNARARPCGSGGKESESVVLVGGLWNCSRRWPVESMTYLSFFGRICILLSSTDT